MTDRTEASRSQRDDRLSEHPAAAPSAVDDPKPVQLNPLDAGAPATDAAGPGTDPATAAERAGSDEPLSAVLLTEPSDGLPEVATTPEALARVIEAMRAGHGPVAVDAERAHGFRYSQRAYLLQLRRAGSGTHLIDPIAYGQPADLSALGSAISDAEWIIHAASQDLTCLAEVGMRPARLFDTELAGRLLAYPRVALGTLLEELFGVRLLKEHSAADWSTRPIPTEWLRYAALDVELLVELRDVLADQLAEAGKLAWAEQEFAALAAGAGAPVEARPDPWRRTSGIHKIRNRRQLAYVVALWTARDELARNLDRAPGRILPDVAITELAAAADPGLPAMRQIPGFARRYAKRYESTWMAALAAARAQPDSALPPLHLPTDGPPQPRLWASKDPVAAARLAKVRAAVGSLAEQHKLPVENLLTPDYLRRLAWRPPSAVSVETVDAALVGYGARPWQRALVVPIITPLLA